jgi:hypothetical protein
MDATTLAAADHAARHWTWGGKAPVRLGSEAHKQAFCRMFHETFNPYKPSVIPWPELDPEALQRLTSLPIWDIAVQTEGKARLRMLSYAAALRDPALSAAIGLNGWEEGRHKEVLSDLVRTYGIDLAPEPPYLEPRDPEWAYLVTGFSECIDSFFAFGLFELARQSGYFPPELVDTFEPVIQEEARHILLFANWLAWHRRNIPWWRRPGFEARVLAVWAFLVWERIGIARGMDQSDNGASDKGGSDEGPGDKPVAQDNNFTMTGAKSVSSTEVSPGALMAICLAENDRRFAGYDPRLVRPTTTPRLVRFALRFMKRGGS